MKRIILCLLFVSVFLFTGCSNDNVEGDLSNLMLKLYEGIPKEDLPNLANTKITKDNIEYYLGITNLDYKEGLASEPAMSSIAHSVVLVRINDIKSVNTIKKSIKEKVNPRKWVCVEVEDENVLVDNIGDLVILVMDNEYASLIMDNFKKLK